MHLRSTWFTEQVSGPPGLHKEILSWKKRKRGGEGKEQSKHKAQVVTWRRITGHFIGLSAQCCRNTESFSSAFQLLVSLIAPLGIDTEPSLLETWFPGFLELQ